MTVRELLDQMDDGSLTVHIPNFYNGVPLEMIFKISSYNEYKDFYEQSRGNVLSSQIKKFISLKEFFNNNTSSIIMNSDSICVSI